MRSGGGKAGREPGTQHVVVPQRFDRSVEGWRTSASRVTTSMAVTPPLKPSAARPSAGGRRPFRFRGDLAELCRALLMTPLPPGHRPARASPQSGRPSPGR